MFDEFYSKLSAIIDSYVPLKQISKRKAKFLHKPWITQGIKKSLIVKNKLCKKFIKTRSLYHHQKFKLNRNMLNHLIKTSKTSY